MTNPPPTQEPEVIRRNNVNPKSWRRHYYRLRIQLCHLLSNWYWKVRGRLWDRYNVLHIKTLPPTWTDRDEVLLHATFTVLTEFMEKELCGIDWDVATLELAKLKAKLVLELDPDEREWIKVDIWNHWHNRQLLDLYNWWKDYASTRHDNVWYSEEGQKEIESKLNQLIQLRGCLWT